MSAPVIDRATAQDVVSLETDVGAAPMQVGAVLFLDASSGFDPEQAIEAIGERIRSVPRLRQRLEATPIGCGRPVFVDASGFRLDWHVDHLRCPAPGDEDAVLELAAETIGNRLPFDRPLWRLSVVTGVDHNRAALIFAFHHVLADGIGGLAVLASLVDGAQGGEDSAFPRCGPSTRLLAADALRSRATALGRVPAQLRAVRTAVGQLRAGRSAPAQPCSLLRPTGPRRRFAVVRADLGDVLSCARRDGATVNDVVLAAVAGALRHLLGSRGETIDRFVISVPVSARRHAAASELGNQVGVVPLEIPAAGEPRDRLRIIAGTTRAATRTSRGASAALLGPVFRLLARVKAFGWFIDRQRLVHTFVTNLKGPATQLRFMGAPIIDAIAVSATAGNVSVAFAVMSYAGHLNITVIADPDACADLDDLRTALQAELDALVSSPTS